MSIKRRVLETVESDISFGFNDDSLAVAIARSSSTGSHTLQQSRRNIDPYTITCYGTELQKINRMLKKCHQ